ncbi:MAG: M48 family metallopeptidase [Candidatus Woesearchaeota archaeon]
MASDFYSQISSNKWKSYMLFVVFTLFILVLAFVFGLGFTNSLYGAIPFLVIAFIFSIIYILIAYYTGDSILLATVKAKPITRKEDPYYYNTVEGLSIAAGVPMPKIYMIKEESINAFATGRDPQHASITITSGARKKLSRQELEGVIAHEISHIKNFDVRTMLLAAVLVGVIVLLSDIMFRAFLWSGGRRDNDRGSGNLGILFVLIAIVLAILAPIIAQLIKLAISRKREYLADANGALLTRYPPGLANALKKIKNDNDKVVDTANKGMAHLWIENPLRNKQSWLNNLFSTHPPIDERIKRLEAM